MADILIADPDPAIRSILSDCLRDSGHRILQAEDGESALRLIQSETVQIVLADQELALQGDNDVIREIKRARPQVPVVVLTGIGEEGAEEILDAGAFATLPKPFDVTEIRRVVDEAIPFSIPVPAKPDAAALAAEARARRKKRRRIAALAAGLTLLAASGAWFYLSRRAGPVQAFNVPYARLSGLAFDGKSLWACDWYEQSLYRHNVDPALSLVQTEKQNSWHPGALAWDGKNLWTGSSWDHKLFRHRMDGHLGEDLDIPSPAEEISGLFWDGSAFWACDARQGRLLRFQIRDGRAQVLQSEKSPGPKPIGICRLGKFLWSADSRTGLLYRYQPENPSKPLGAYTLPDAIRWEKMACFTCDGKDFWIGTETSQKIYRIPPARLQRLTP